MRVSVCRDVERKQGKRDTEGKERGSERGRERGREGERESRFYSPVP